MFGKSPIKSKTLIFNVLALVVGLAGYFGFIDFKADPNVAPLAAGIAALVSILLPILTPVINIALRFATKEPITFKKR